MFTQWPRLEPIVDLPFEQESAGELLVQADDAEDAGEQRHSVLLRYPRSFAKQEPLHVRLREPACGQAQGKDFSLPLPLKHRQLCLQQLQFSGLEGQGSNSKSRYVA